MSLEPKAQAVLEHEQQDKGRGLDGEPEPEPCADDRDPESRYSQRRYVEERLLHELKAAHACDECQPSQADQHDAPQDVVRAHDLLRTEHQEGEGQRDCNEPYATDPRSYVGAIVTNPRQREQDAEPNERHVGGEDPPPVDHLHEHACHDGPEDRSEEGRPDGNGQRLHYLRLACLVEHDHAGNWRHQRAPGSLQHTRTAGPQHFALADQDGALVGPFGIMLHAPALGGPLQDLGAAIRYRTSLSAQVREIAILSIAAATDSAFERYAHERVGRAAARFAVPERPSKLDPFAEKLAGWLRTEAAKSRKQRRSAKQLHADLIALGYTGSYNRVAAFAREWRADRQREQQTTGRGTFVPLTFRPGEAFQFDWSEDHAVLGGERTKLQVAHMKLSHSRAFLVRAYLLQTHEMLFEAHWHGFHVFGGVPGRGIYDNMRTAVDRIGRGKERDATADQSMTVAADRDERTLKRQASGARPSRHPR